MKFYIEIIRDDPVSAKVVYSTTVDEMSPSRAKTKAATLINLYASRGANKARILNDKKEELFVL
jgi:hypothetical protein